ncbi:acyl carrier protein [Vibrio crassostreae]|uniref:acyl carrier protein n=1 Tax=Vibrio crassostreae TaxID=246167 RepID=UPI001B3028A0|nr:phosphopantetheine-binding protein [Vibrio crassostreae]
MKSTEHRVLSILGDHIGIITESLDSKAILTDMYRLDSLDMMELVMGIEEEFDISIPDDTISVMVTVSEIVRAVDEIRAD